MSASALFLLPQSRVIYDRSSTQYDAEYPGIEKTAALAKQWTRKAELLAIPQIAKTFKADKLDFVQFHDFLADARQSCDYTRKNPVSIALGSLTHAA